MGWEGVWNLPEKGTKQLINQQWCRHQVVAELHLLLLNITMNSHVARRASNVWTK